MAKLTDSSLMPFGVHKDKQLVDVPAQYLLWLLNTGLKDGNLKDYILDVKSALEQEVRGAKNTTQK